MGQPDVFAVLNMIKKKKEKGRERRKNYGMNLPLHDVCSALIRDVRRVATGRHTRTAKESARSRFIVCFLLIRDQQAPSQMISSNCFLNHINICIFGKKWNQKSKCLDKNNHFNKALKFIFFLLRPPDWFSHVESQSFGAVNLLRMWRLMNGSLVCSPRNRKYSA